MGRGAADSSHLAQADNYPRRGGGAGEDANAGTALTSDWRGVGGRYSQRNATRRLRALYGNAYSRPDAARFLARYPELRIEVEINNQPVSLVGERIDVAIRITDNPEPGAIARRLGDCESVLCASEAYLRQHGTPQTLEDLTQHNCLYYSGFAGKSWHFLNEQGEAVSVAIKGNLSAGISSLLCESALAGMGIALVPEKEAREGLAQGRLVRLLPTLQPRRLAVYGLYLSREHQPAGLRLFLEAIQTAMP